MDNDKLLQHIMDIKETQAATHAKVCEMAEDHKEFKEDLRKDKEALHEVETRVAVVENKIKTSTKLQLGLSAILPTVGAFLYWLLKSRI